MLEFMTAPTLWDAVVNRNANADGTFVYAVRSTGIYCRPSCASRKPKRDRVAFFPTAAMAESEGYRACRRCRPDAALPVVRASDVVGRVCREIARRPDARWTSAALARAGGTSVATLQRGFRRTLGLSPRDYVAACRRRRFLDTLKEGRRVTDAIYEAGYGSPSRVYGELSVPGMTPASYGRGGEGASIGWATVRTRVGRVLVASSGRGLCFVSIGATSAQLVASLRREFPKARIDSRPSTSLTPLLDAIRRLAAGGPWNDAVPLDIRGTAFQWRVWRALARIPVGQTRSYGAVAASLGNRKASRAVARACATNPVALVVPCHRVVGADGSPGGYRWGRDVKKRVLEAEE
jgi:AraC family transcriptional regulator of adaptative response/methylated-DNA-[protein]-cysteine methyltransferase